MGTEGLRAGIKAEGLEEGRDVRFDVRSAGAEERTVAPLAAALARENPDVIVGPLAPVVADPPPESRCSLRACARRPRFVEEAVMPSC